MHGVFMPIVQIILVLVVVGVALWLINQYVTTPVKTILNIAIGILLFLWVAVMLFPGLMGIRVGR